MTKLSSEEIRDLQLREARLKLEESLQRIIKKFIARIRAAELQHTNRKAR